MIGAAALTGSAIAGPAPVVAAEKSSCGSWCETLASIGQIYSDKENPYVQSVKVFGRAQVQWAYLDGNDASDRDFSETYDEIRRLRLGGEVKFLNGFKLKANANLVSDGHPKGGARKFGYQDFDQAKLSYTTKDLFSLDEASITYGRHKVALGSEQHTSSKKIKTVERSAISNKLTSGRATGVTFDTSRGIWNGTFGVFSTQDSGELVGGWSEGQAFYLSNGFAIGEGSLLVDFLYNNQDKADNADISFGYKYALSAAYNRELGDWDTTFNGVYGDNYGDDGNFYGFVALTAYEIVEDKVEFVARYAYQGSSEKGEIKPNSRYLRREKDGVDRDFDGADSHNSLYGGFNFYLCGDRSKIMTGLEYDNVSAENGTGTGATAWMAYRMYF